MNKGTKTSHAVIAVAKDDGRFKAVELRRHDGTVEVVWTRSLPADDQTWSTFAAACGLTSVHAPDKATRKHSDAVVGLDPTGVVFYRLNVPAVAPEEMAAIVRMQAEALLPLPAPQIEVAWRTSPSTNGKIDITLAAARKEYLQRFANNVRDFRPRRILLSCEGTARAWRSLFADRPRQALVVSVGTENTQVCLVQNGEVTQAAVLDTGLANLAPAPGAAVPAEGLGRFAQDIQAMQASFGGAEPGDWPIVVLSDGGEVLARIVESLQAAGLPAEAAVPKAHLLRAPADFGVRDVYEYRVPLGLALTALDPSAGALDLFEHVREGEQQQAGSGRRSVLLAGALAALMFLALLVTWYLVDVTLAARLKAQVADPNFEAARQHQALLKIVARHRPDILQLLLDVNAGQNEGVVLDSLHFKKGQAVTLTCQAGNMEQMWKYEANLREQKGIENVEITNSPVDAKTKKIKFTITFQYRNFTKKGAAL